MRGMNTPPSITYGFQPWAIVFISTLESEFGRLFSTEREIEEETIGFFPKLHKVDECPQFTIEGIDWVLLDSQKSSRLERLFQEEKIIITIKDTNSHKSQAYMRWQGGFIDKIWNILNLDLVEMFQEFFENNIISKRRNETCVCSIPKKKASRVGDFLPINLISPLHMVIAKVLAKRLNEVLPTQLVMVR